MNMNDDCFEGMVSELEALGLPVKAKWLRERDAAQREALARVEAAYANRLRNVKQLETERDTARVQLAEAVGLLRQIDGGEPLLDCSTAKALEAFLARTTQAEQQEAQGAQVGDEERPECFCVEHGLHIETLQQQLAEARAALATQPAAGEPIGKIVSFGPKLHEVAWHKGKLPPLGTELYAAPPAAAHGDEAVRKDAERYRWLRACGDEWGNLRFLDSRGDVDAEALDEAIDAAMRAQGDGD